MVNELIFLLSVIIISGSALIALRFGKEALVSFIALQAILANLFVIKQTTLFGFTATCADAFTVGGVLGINLLQEYYGKRITKKTIWIGFFLLIFYTICSQIHLLYIPDVHDHAQRHYHSILAFMPRITIASCLIYLVIQHIDTFLYGLFKLILSGKYLFVRSYLSLAISQLLDTILFSFLGLYGIVQDIWEIIFISYIVKILVVCIATPFVLLSKKMHTNQ